MKLFEKIKMKVKSGKATIFFVCGFSVLIKIKRSNNKKKYRLFPALRKRSYAAKPGKNEPVFYLKVNRVCDYTFICIQRWIDIVEACGNDFYFLCDNKELKLEILRRITFKNANVKFIKSDIKRTKDIVKNIAVPRWYKAGWAHLTTFFHSRDKGINEFWNIDADDTMFLAPPEITARMLIKVKEYANEHDLTMFSLDMWRSSANGRTWTYGVTYINNKTDYIAFHKKLTDMSWNTYEWNEGFSSCDIFILYLLDEGNPHIGTFYIENAYFFHFASLEIDNRSFFCQWKDGNLIAPIIVNIYNDSEAGIIPIAKDCVKIDLGLNETEMLDYHYYRLNNLSFYPGEKFEHYQNVRKKFCKE